LICDPTFRYNWTDPDQPWFNCMDCEAPPYCHISTCSMTSSACTVERNMVSQECHCNIGGTLYFTGEQNPADPAYACLPTNNYNDWTYMPSQIDCTQWSTCGDCLMKTAYCGWCAANGTCMPGDPSGPSTGYTCPYNWAWSSQSDDEVGEGQNVEGNAIQPAIISVKMRPGSTVTITVNVTRPAAPYLDFYLLADASASMSTFLGLLATSANAIRSALLTEATDLQMGFGSFLDKPLLPRGMHPWTWVYKNELGLTFNTTEFVLAVESFKTLYNYDHPESALEPLMLAAWDHDNSVGWRSNVYHMALVATDTGSWEGGREWPSNRMAWSGDPRTIIGIHTPNNGDGIADGNPPGTGEGYPTREQVKSVLISKQIQPVFAASNADSQIWNYYQELVNDFGFGVVIPFAQDEQQEMVEGIVTGLRENLKSMVLAPEVDPYGVITNISPAKYTGVEAGQSRLFDITLTLPTGLDNNIYTDGQKLTVRYVGWPHTLTINIDSVLDCKSCSQTIPNLKYDACGVCGGNETCRGCDGLLWSGIEIDDCGICGGDGSTCVGCDNVSNSNMQYDVCGVCNGDNSTCLGCDDVPNSGREWNECGCGVACNMEMTNAIIGLAVVAAVGILLAIGAAIFAFRARAHMLAIDKELLDKLNSNNVSPIYKSNKNERTNPLFKEKSTE